MNIENNRRALLFGASGLVGAELLKLLTNSEHYAEILIFVRKELTLIHPKIKSVVVKDFFDPSLGQYFIPGAHAFCCIGTTRKKTPNLEAYRKIDLGIPKMLAQWCQEGKCDGLFVVSAMGANAASSNFYSKMKGEMEQEVTSFKVPNTHFFRPSLLLGNRNEFRLGEKIGIALFSLLSPLFIGSLKKYKGIEAEKVAQAMLLVAIHGASNQVIENNQIFTLSNA